MWVDGGRREGLRGSRAERSREEGTAQGPQEEMGGPLLRAGDSGQCLRFRSYTHPHPTPNRSLEGDWAGLRWGCPEPQVPTFLPSLPTGFPSPAKPLFGRSQNLPRGVDRTLWPEQTRYLDGASGVRVSPRVPAPGDSVLGALLKRTARPS